MNTTYILAQLKIVEAFNNSIDILLKNSDVPSFVISSMIQESNKILNKIILHVDKQED